MKKLYFQLGINGNLERISSLPTKSRASAYQYVVMEVKSEEGKDDIIHSINVAKSKDFPEDVANPKAVDTIVTGTKEDHDKLKEQEGQGKKTKKEKEEPAA